MSSVRVVLAALRRGPIRRTLLAYACFAVVEWAAWIALLVWAYGERGVTGAATVSVAALAPSVLVAPLASALGDRFRRGPALATGYALQATAATATAVALATEAPFAAVVVGGAALTSAVTLTRPVHLSAMPELALNPSQLTAANAGTSAADGTGAFLGPLLSGLLIVVAGPELVLAASGALMVVAALLVLRLPTTTGARYSTREGAWRTVSAGFREVRRETSAAVLLGVVLAQYVVIGLLDILLVVLALDVLATDRSGPGFLGSAFGVGTVLGAMAAVLLVGRRRLLPFLVLGLVLTGLPLTGLGWSGSLLLAAPLLAMAGAGKTLADVAGRTLLQRTVSDEVMARVFGLHESLMSAATAAGAVLAPLLVAGVGAEGALVATGALLPLTGLLVWGTLRRIEARAVPPGPHLDALLGVPFLRLAPVPVAESLSRRAVAVEVPADHVVVTEGEPGDRFYVVVEGEVEVTQQGRQLRRLGAGSSFGEIALLHERPRTATVRSLGPTRLAAIGRHDFLDALGTPGSRTAADEVAEGYLASDAG